ncbi:MAG: hybrid sensor histidine kinase/response regulator, partial [Calditrichaeota bacterium]|nr:hybrid sensor histidine kinase/response regulator [Calditrichota bacterium]
MNFNIPFFFAWICLIRVVCLNAQDRAISQKAWQEAGHPYIQNFSPQDYNGEIQNFAIVQDKRGVLFFGNNVGVLSYDGVSWKSIATPGRTAVRSLCLVDDRIYVGAIGDMGYLEPDTAGQLNYVSILSDLPEENRDFKDVYDTFAFGDAVYFRTRYYMIRWANGRVRVWKSPREFRRAFVVNNAFYIIQSETGLFRMTGDSLRLVPGGDIFARMDVRMMLPYDN